MIIYRRPKIDDKKSVFELFETSIQDTFRENDINDPEDMAIEIRKKHDYLTLDFVSEGKESCFYIAIDDDTQKVVGAIGIYNANVMIRELTDDKLKDMTEMGSLYVHPDYQGHGIGQDLIMCAQDELKKRGLKEYCFDCGYKTAMKTWVKRFGDPTYFYENHWDEGDHHMIWVKSVES